MLGAIILENKIIHPVLVNKRSRKVASSHYWLLALATLSRIEGHSSGLSSLLPLQQAEKSLRKNEIVYKVKRGKSSNTLTKSVRAQAKSILPFATAEFCKMQNPYRLVTKKDFSKWIVETLLDQTSQIYKRLTNMGYDELLTSERSHRWWQDQIKKMQS